MIKIIFICHGNICRSPMAEFIMKDLVNKKGLSNNFHIISKATSNEEEGNHIHPGTRNILIREHIYFDSNKTASQLKKEDYNNYDLFIVMDDYNLQDTIKILNNHNKVLKLLDRNIIDPWYTGDFDITYKDIKEGCIKLLNYILEDKYLNKKL